MPMPVGDLIIDIPNYRLDLLGSVPDSTFYQSNDCYSLIQDLFDEQGAIALPGAMRLKIPMVSRGQFDFVVTNKWYMTQRLIKHLKGASISSSGYTNEIYRLSFQSSGYVNCIASDIGKTVVSGANIGKLVDYDNARRIWKVRSPGSGWGNSLSVTITSGTGAGTTLTSGGAATGEDLHANFYTVGDTVSGNKYFALGGVIHDGTGWFGSGNSGAGNIHLDILATVRESGVLIGTTPRVFSRNWGETYDWAEADVSGGGRTPIPLATQLDGNNTTTYSTIAARVDSGQGGTGATSQIRVDFGSYTADINLDGTNETYEGRIDADGVALPIVYEALKFITGRANSAITIDGIAASIYTAADPAYTPIKSAPFGTFAGGKLFVARGIYPINLIDADKSNYQVITSAGEQIETPIYGLIIATGLVVGLSLAVYRASLIDPTEVDSALYTLATGNNAGNSTLTIQQPISIDTPTTGKLRIVNPATQAEDSYNYSGYNILTKTFTLTSALTRNYSNTETMYIGYIDKIATGTSESVAVRIDPARVGQPIIATARKATGSFKMEATTIVVPFTETGVAIPINVNEDTINTNS